MAGLPSKYAKMGFKKGWAAYRAARSSITVTRRRRRTTKGAQVAKRRRKSYRASSGGAGGGVSMREILMHAGYGAVRGDILRFASPVVQMIPAGAYADNVTLGLGAYALNRFNIGGPLVKQATKAIVLSEAFVAGAKARSGISISAGAQASSAYL